MNYVLANSFLLQTLFRDMHDLSSPDPISMLFELAEDFESRSKRFYGIFGYALLAGIFLTLLASLGVILAFLTQQWLLSLALLLVIPVSLVAAIWAYKEDDFITDFRRRLEMIARARAWVPNPPIPPGDDPLSRLTSYLALDERYGPNRKVKVDRPYLARGKSGREFEFGCRVLAKGSPWVWGPDSHQVIAQRFPGIVTMPDLAKLRTSVEDVLTEKDSPLTRIIALVEGGPLSSELAEYASTAWVRYKVLGTKRPREIPIELMVELTDGTYEILPLFYVS
jgi:hypothetical protein